MENLDFELTGKYTKQTLKKVQERLLEMANIATNILDKNGYKYFIAFGTLLGAVRHQGFIPWDDDFDIFLFEEDYDAAIDCLRKELPKDIIVHDQQTDLSYYANWSKLRDLNSRTHCSAYPDDNNHKYTGVNVDLYKLKRVNRNHVDSHIKREHIEFLIRKNDAGFFSKDKYINQLNKLCNEYIELIKIESLHDDLIDDDVFAFVVALKQIEISDILPLKKYHFEGIQFWGPNNYDAFLSNVYGNYMRIPDFTNRKPHCDYVEFFDCNHK